MALNYHTVWTSRGTESYSTLLTLERNDVNLKHAVVLDHPITSWQKPHAYTLEVASPYTRIRNNIPP